MRKSSKSFLSSLDIGNEGEKLVIQYFTSKNRKCVKADKGIAYDLLLDDKIKLEVKYDVMSVKTKNIAIEFWNSKLDKKSGISATEADYWVQVAFDTSSQTMSIFYTKLEDLANFIKNNTPHKIIIGGGDNNANLYIYKIEHIILGENSPFKRIEDFNE